MAEFTPEQKNLISATEEAMLYGEEPCQMCEGRGEIVSNPVKVYNKPWAEPKYEECELCGGDGVIRYLKRHLTFEEAIEFAA